MQTLFNHKMGADSEQEFDAVPLDDNRHHALGMARSQCMDELLVSWS